MNIFYFTNDTELNAKLLDDKRVVKMVLETTQLLSNSIFLNGGKSVYKPVSLKHPCTIWAAKSTANWKWLKKYGLALAKEYTRRYGRTHACESIIKSLKCPQIKDNTFYNPPQCMPEEYRQKTTIEGYKQYYIHKKLNYNYFKRTENWVYDFWKKVIPQ